MSEKTPHYYRDDWKDSSRHLTEEGYAHANLMIMALKHVSPETQGELINDLIVFAQPVVERIVEREIDLAIDDFIKHDHHVTEADIQTLREEMENAVADALAKTAELIQPEGKRIVEWSDFSQPIHSRAKQVRQGKVRKILNHDTDVQLSTKEAHAIPAPSDVPSTHAIRIEEAHQEKIRSRIDQVLQTLTYREREVIKLRHGLGDGYIYTLEEVGQIFQATRERIRQIESKALRKLQHPVRAGQLREFVDPDVKPMLDKQQDEEQGLTALETLIARVLERVEPEAPGHAESEESKRNQVNNDRVITR